MGIRRRSGGNVRNVFDRGKVLSRRKFGRHTRRCRNAEYGEGGNYILKKNSTGTGEKQSKGVKPGRNGNVLPVEAQFKPGQSGNPKGSPPGPRFSTLIKKFLDGQDVVIEGGKKTKKFRDLILIHRLYRNAVADRVSEGDSTRAIQTIMDRIDGKAFQPLTGLEGTPLAPPNITIEVVDGGEDPG